MTARQLPATEYASLKASTRKLVKAIGTQTDAANATRVGQQAISDYMSTSDDKAELFTPIDVVADLEAECGQPVITRKLAELSGHILVPLPQTQGRGDRLDRITDKTVKEFSDVLSAVIKARDDGKFTAAEKAHCRGEIRELQAMLALLDLQIHAEGEQ